MAWPVCRAQTPQTVRLGIDEMFALADENNAGIRGFRYAESAAAEAVKTARNDRLPSIDFSAIIMFARRLSNHLVAIFFSGF